MPTKIRNVELLTLARSDAGTPVLGHVGVGIDANLIQDFEMGLSRVSSAAQFNLALNTEGATTNTAHFGGIAFTQGASADTVMASIKAVNTSVDGYVDLSFNTRSVSNALYIKSDGNVGINLDQPSRELEVTGTGNVYVRVTAPTANDSAALELKNTNELWTIKADDTSSPPDAFKITNSNGTAVTIKTNDHFQIGNFSTVSPDGHKLFVGGEVMNSAAVAQFDGFIRLKQNIYISDASTPANYVGWGIIGNSLATSPGGSGTHKVGIGTGSSAPGAKLVIEGDSDNGDTDCSIHIIDNDSTVGSSVPNISFRSGASTQIYGIRANDTLGLTFRDSSDATKIVFDTDGKVGIGTGSSSLDAKLEIQATSAPDIFLRTTTGNQSESGRIRLGENVNTFQGGFIHYNGSTNLFNLGVHNTSDETIANDINAISIAYADGKVGIGTGSNGPSDALTVGDGTNSVGITINKSDAGTGALEFESAGTDKCYIRCNASEDLIFGTSDTDRVSIMSGGSVGIGTGVSALTELLEVNGNVKATKFIGPLEGNADTATTATTLETARNIVVGKSSAGAGDIDAITQSFDGGANISFDSELNSHLPSNLRATTSSNIADEPSNNAVKIIGSDINTPRLKINRQGLIVGFEEVATSGGGGSGGISALTLNTNGLLYLNSGFTSQTETTSTSTPTLNLYLDAGGLFTALTESTGTMSITIGGTTKTLDLPDASFTQLDLSGTDLQVTVGSTTRTRDLSGLSVASATNAANADNIAISSENTDATRYLSFVNGTSGDRALKVDTDLTYNPSSNTLTTTTFSGALSGNATTSSGLLSGSTTYSPSTDSTGSTAVIRNSSGDSNFRYVNVSYVNSSDDVSNDNISHIMAKFGDDYLRSATASKVRAFLGSDRFLPAPSGGVYSITVSNATSATSASSASVATRLNTTSNGIVKTTSGNGTLSIGSLSSGDIPDNDADTTGNATTATTASELSWSGSGRSADLAANANTIVVRGSSGAVNVGALGCTSISASASITSSTTMEAQKITLTNTSDSLRAKDIRPYGTVTNLGGGFFPDFYGVAGSKIGDHDSSSIGGFETISGKTIYNLQGTVISDERIKENISNFNVGLDFIRLLQPKKYTYKGSSSPRSHYGVIAQEIEEVINTLSLENPSFINTLDYHDKTDEERENDVKAYDRDQIMWVLFNAVKQLDAEVQDLKKQLEEN